MPKHRSQAPREPIRVPSPAELNKGYFTRAKLASWGVEWPPPKGWRKKLEAEWYIQSLKAEPVSAWIAPKDPMPAPHEVPAGLPRDPHAMTKHEKIAIGQSRLADIL